MALQRALFYHHVISNQLYSGYTAYIYEGENAPSAEAKGEHMKLKLPGADYDVVEGDPCGQCSDVEGKDPKTANAIRDWINRVG